MFWIIIAVLTLIALAFIVPSLIGRHDFKDGTREQNISIAKEQLAELELRFEKGDINEDAYQSSKKELELSLFNDLKETDANEGAPIPIKGGSAWLLLLIIPLIAVPAYLQLGNLDYAEQVDPEVIAKKAPADDRVPMKADGTPDFEKLAEKLKIETEQDPSDPKRWFALGRSYMMVKKFPDAVKSLEKSLALDPDNTATMLSLVDSLSMSNNRKLTGRPRDLLQKVLSKEPNNQTALWLSGMAASQEKEFLEAIKSWQQLLPYLENKPEEKTILNLINVAKQRLSPQEKAQFAAMDKKIDDNKSKAPVIVAPVNESTGSVAASVKVKISLSDSLKENVSENDFVFIYAKAMSGPPMPLAAVKKQVKDLPLEIELNDEMAMMPSLKLSSFQNVSVGARVSKTGQPIANDGDLFGEKGDITLGDSVSIEIDQTYKKAETEGGSKAPVEAKVEETKITKEPVSVAPVKESTGSAGVKVKISLSDSLKESVSENDFVFIYAKAMSGPPMPLAAVKKQVKDLPLEIELNDQMAMMPNLKLSSFKNVSVGARVSKTGQPIANDGDLFGEKGDVTLGDSISIEIDQTYKK